MAVACVICLVINHYSYGSPVTTLTAKIEVWANDPNQYVEDEAEETFSCSLVFT